MPVQVSYPGVYVEEVPSGVRTISDVSTAIAAFFGRTLDGPLDTAVRCTCYADFQRTFRAGAPGSDLAGAVRMFFENGGADCYVVRLAHGARRAEKDLPGFASSPRNVLTVQAKNAGEGGNALRIAVDYDTVAPDETFNMQVFRRSDGGLEQVEEFRDLSMDPLSPLYAPEHVTARSEHITVAVAASLPAVPPCGFSQSGRVVDTTSESLGSLLNALMYPPAVDDSIMSSFRMSVNYGDFAEIDLRGAPDTAPAFDDGAGPQEVLDELARRINDRLGSPTIACEWVPVNADNTGVGFIRIVPIDSSSSDRRSVRVERADDNDMTEALMLGVKQGGIEPSQYSILRPAPTGTVLGTDGVFTESGSDIPLAYQPQDAFNQITVNAPRFTIDLGTALGTGGRWYQDSGGGYDGIRERIALIAEAIDAAPDLPFEAKIWKHFGHRYHLVLLPEQLERAGAELNVTTSGGAGVDIGGLFRTGPCLYALDGGDSGSALQPADYLGSELDQTGMYALDPVDQFNLMVIPEDRDIDEAGYQRIIQRASTYCRAKRAFLLADPPASWTTPAGRPAVDRTVVDNFRTGLATTYAAVFYPRVLVTENGVNRSVGASAMVAGLMARTDVAKGVWKAPAGIDAYLSGLSGPAVNLTDRENGVLNKLGVNCLRSMAGRVVNWGARTLDGDDRMASQWKYIPVRRLALFIEESLYRGTHWVVFEPNDEPLWANIRMNVGAFMHGLFRRGAFQGGTPDKAYFVRCDETTTTRADRNRGVVNIEVGFAPLKPAEFVVIKIQQIAGNLV